MFPACVRFPLSYTSRGLNLQVALSVAGLRSTDTGVPAPADPAPVKVCGASSWCKRAALVLSEMLPETN